MFMKFFTRICIVFVATELLVALVVIHGIELNVPVAQTGEAAVIVTQPEPTIESSTDDMVRILVEEAKITSDDMFEGLNDEELECVFTTLLNEFDFSEMVAIGNGSPDYLPRLVEVEQTWIDVCGLDWFVDSYYDAVDA